MEVSGQDCEIKPIVRGRLAYCYYYSSGEGYAPDPGLCLEELESSTSDVAICNQCQTRFCIGRYSKFMDWHRFNGEAGGRVTEPPVRPPAWKEAHIHQRTNHIHSLGPAIGFYADLPEEQFGTREARV
ncbi:hypothetical protein NHX12_003976 [Muraenolepis orangiensis]|uniref:Uncharacterized protein n=1 Tax=Muraenolepis orangiensis TaxID=630683 RepID=A0A9Q0IDD2_9TELE|nr:hypothetical protein NHX12_003976 [Muraenolepis orangiensis]